MAEIFAATRVDNQGDSAITEDRAEINFVGSLTQDAEEGEKEFVVSPGFSTVFTDNLQEVDSFQLIRWVTLARADCNSCVTKTKRRAVDEGVEVLASVSTALDVTVDGPWMVCSSRPAMDDLIFSTNSIDYRSDQSSVKSPIAPVGFQTQLFSVSFLDCSFLPVQLRFGFASAPLLVLMSSWRVLGANSPSQRRHSD